MVTDWWSAKLYEIFFAFPSRTLFFNSDSVSWVTGKASIVCPVKILLQQFS